jgi:hypothetical protein
MGWKWVGEGKHQIKMGYYIEAVLGYAIKNAQNPGGVLRDAKQ